jgi:hypothetical protein
MAFLGDMIANIIAKKVLRWVILFALNIIGIVSVVGVPIAIIIDAIVIILLIKSLFDTSKTVAKGAWFVIKKLALITFWLTIIVILIIVVIGCFQQAS